MFKKNQHTSHFEMIIGSTSHISGDIESAGSIRIDGKVTGNITTEANLIISESSVVKGDIKCANADIYGKCDGNAFATGTVNLYEKGTLTGDLKAKGFSSAEGASFRGSCEINPDSAPSTAGSQKSKAASKNSEQTEKSDVPS